MQPKVGHPRGRPAIGGTDCPWIEEGLFPSRAPDSTQICGFQPICCVILGHLPQHVVADKPTRTDTGSALARGPYVNITCKFSSGMNLSSNSPGSTADPARHAASKVHGPWPMRRRCGRKPNSVPLRVTIISLRLPLPDSSEHATRPILRTTGALRRGLLALARDGVCPASSVTRGAVRSYRTVSPLPPCGGGLFSVALSLTPAPGPVVVSHHRVLPCSDFPPVGFPTSDRLTMCKD